MGRIVRLLLATCFLLLGAAPLLAATSEGAVVVADVRGPLDQRALDFLTEAVGTPDARVVVIQVNNPGIASGDPTELFAAVAGSPVPVTAWVGPSGAEAYGGVAELLTLTAYRGAAPGAHVGYLGRRMAGGATTESVRGDVDPAVLNGAVEVFDPVAGVVDEVVPTIGQFIAALDGRELATGNGSVVIETTEPAVADDGTEIVIAAGEVRFLKPGLLTRFLRLAIRPEAMVFFLLVGLAAAAFEFYAAGIGVTAGVASVSLFLAGYGIATLPMRWISLVGLLAGMVLYTIDFQNATISWRGVLGTILLLAGGLTITDASPQFGPRWWAVVLTVVGVASFYIVALTTVARSRFSTRTIGREHLVGRVGVAETTFDPTGIVDLGGARWQARSHRAAGIAPGDPVEVLAVAGIVLEIGPHVPQDTDVRE